MISVDNLSERGSNRLVVSYDAGQSAIVWDILTGDEIARFVSYEHIRVAAWMRNGNVAFGMVSKTPGLIAFPNAYSFGENKKAMHRVM